jgi:predicted membrane protein
MEQSERKYPGPSSKIWTGLFLIVVGILLLANKMHAGIPDWIFTWPVLAIAIGILIGIQHRFRNFFWLIPLFWGSFALVDQQMPQLNLHNYTAPLVIILIGLFFIFRRNSRYPGNAQRREWKNQWRSMRHSYDINSSTDGEWLDSTSVFGGAKKVIVSKNFKGGDITCFMGGAEIDLSQADIQGKVVMDATAIFGGIKIIVPPNWDIKIEITAVFGGIDDKRPVQLVHADPNKMLVLDGAAVFGGIEINSY